jgi:monovalent cation/hydrogen antiporter
METVSLVLLLLLAVVASSALARMSPVSIPAPLVQIALGAVIGLSTNIRVELDPDIFFLLFLPPLLFLDGWRIPKDELMRDKALVLELALGLVVVTVLGMGTLLHILIPMMPLAVAFALAAVLSPTDPIAVSAIASRAPIPRRMMHILEGESLFNDASGLVCLRFAIAAALTGEFSAGKAALSFLWAAGAGLLIGAGLAYCVTRAKGWISARYGEDWGSQILISLLIPFGAYLLAEHLHASGILAAVAAGVSMTFAEFSIQSLPVTRMRRGSVWDTIQFAGNGIIFVLLGEQFPHIVHSAAQTVETAGHQSSWWLVYYVVVVTLGLAALRFAWVWGSMRLTMLKKREQRPFRSSELRLVSAMSFAGVRGAITLAGILTLPLTMTDGSAFPARDLAIFIAAGVILLSLVIATVALPMLLNGLEMPSEDAGIEEEDRVRLTLAKAAVAAIDQARDRMAAGADDSGAYDRAAGRVAGIYQDRIDLKSRDGDAAHAARYEDQVEQRLRLAAFRAQRDLLFRMARQREVGSALANKLTRELDLIEMRVKGVA